MCRYVSMYIDRQKQPDRQNERQSWTTTNSGIKTTKRAARQTAIHYREQRERERHMKSARFRRCRFFLLTRRMEYEIPLEALDGIQQLVFSIRFVMHFLLRCLYLIFCCLMVGTTQSTKNVITNYNSAKETCTTYDAQRQQISN